MCSPIDRMCSPIDVMCSLLECTHLREMWSTRLRGVQAHILKVESVFSIDRMCSLYASGVQADLLNSVNTLYVTNI
jgi:hypothetical protein